jgi:small subunit ribosomal protein S6
MSFYETVFIARQDLSETQVKELATHFSKVITDNGGKIAKTEHWGLRSFAYKINKSRKGHYVLIESDAPGDAIIEMERQMRLHDDIVRSMTIKLDEPTKGPSVVMDGDKNEERKAA